MAIRIAKRAYKMSDARLVQATDSVLQSATRDLTELASFGVTAPKIAAVETLRNTFANLPTDEELMGDMMIATAAKDELMTKVCEEIRPIIRRAQVKFGDGSPEVRKFAADGLSRLGEDELVRTAFRVVRVGTGFLTALSTEGLTQDILDALEAVAGELDVAVDTQDDAVNDRDIAVDGRIKAGNDLYAAVVNMCTYGKSAWENTNEAKYNDYVLSEVSKKHAQVLTGTLSADAIANLSATDFSPTTKINAKATSGKFKIYFAALATDAAPADATIIDGTLLESTAAALGYDATLRTRLNVQAVTDAQYEVEVES